MNCPACGLQSLPDQKFCRTCGKSLRAVSRPDSIQKSEVRENSLLHEQEKARTPYWMLWGFIITFIGVAIGVVGKKLLHVDLVTTVGILISLAGMFATVYPQLSQPTRRRPRPTPSSDPEPLIQSLPTKELVENKIEYIPSVTERTTNLLDTPTSASRPTQNKVLTEKHADFE
jgi:hypothetical protein